MDPITQRILDQQKAIAQNPGFTGYQPSASSLDQDIMNLQTPPNGIAAIQAAPVNQPMMMQDTFVEEKPIDIKEYSKNIGKKMVTDYAIKKLGFDGIKGNLLKSAMGSNLMGFSNPLSAAFTIGSFLPDSVKGIAGLLRGKRAEKAIARDIIADSQGFKDKTISPKITNMQPTNKDIQMGDGGKPTVTTTSPKSYQGTNPYGGGPGGLHSNF
jgi:hypothetical protein